MGSQSGIDLAARFHNASSALSICAGQSPRIQRSWIQWAPAMPSPASIARTNSRARSRSDRLRNGRWLGGFGNGWARLLEQAHDALVLLDVPAVLVVVSRDRHRN